MAPITLIEDGSVVGQIPSGLVYNDSGKILGISYRLIKDGTALYLVAEIPKEVYGWDGPIYIDPSQTPGFSKNFFAHLA
mgnify:CR=1 FL=1